MTNRSNRLLEVTDLKKYFYIKRGFRESQILKAVDGVDFHLDEGEVLGVVGESGCGKTTLGRTVLRLYHPTSGSILFQGMDLSKLSGKEMRKARGHMQIIFQDPYSSLNPRMTVGRMLNQILHSHGVKDSRERKMRCYDVMEKVGLEPAHLKRFPHEFSGGQRQRIAIARALILNPKFIVADEPSSALDMSIQAQILNLMKSLQRELGISYIFITHNLSAARFICDRIAVMYLGKIVEIAQRRELYQSPSHPYTKALLNLCPVPDPGSALGKVPLTGEVPSPIDPPSGCRFHPRCPHKMGLCAEQEPATHHLDEGHEVVCHLYHG
ncbi:MAG: ABC transporter ATP-binding protein [Deltaproteobacteria bacterium]|nr:ABC transporter ATP-binding protein [Deltaproteobacteria bacterium]MBW2136473.1 ABC transporter ATP-binding protein [Deltaproteobacteria bacterium]